MGLCPSYSHLQLERDNYLFEWVSRFFLRIKKNQRKKQQKERKSGPYL
jgi:hypothetical protein